MDSEQQEMCITASMNARSLEEMMLTSSQVMAMSMDDVNDAIERVDQMKECLMMLWQLRLKDQEFDDEDE